MEPTKRAVPTKIYAAIGLLFTSLLCTQCGCQKRPTPEEEYSEGKITHARIDKEMQGTQYTFLRKVLKDILNGKPVDVDTEDLEKNPVIYWATKFSPAYVQLLLDKGAKVNKQSGTTGETALHQAAREGNEAMVQLLLERGADLKIKSNSGKTALDVAKERGNKEIVDMLQKHNP